MQEEPLIWLERSSAVMEFLRRSDLICVPERHVWLFKANALDQLAAFLQNSSVEPHELLRDPDAE